jgi:large subunit ribosomal protein L29
MPTKKFTELQEFTDSDLLNELKETQEQYRKMKFDHTIKGLDNPLSIRIVKRDIARMKTEVRRRELAEMPDEERRNKKRSRAGRKAAIKRVKQ